MATQQHNDSSGRIDSPVARASDGVALHVQDYRQASCGCCTGREAVEHADWGSYTVRVDQCVCWMHQDAPRGNLARRCSVHQPAPGVIVYDARSAA